MLLLCGLAIDDNDDLSLSVFGKCVWDALYNGNTNDDDDYGDDGSLFKHVLSERKTELETELQRIIAQRRDCVEASRRAVLNSMTSVKLHSGNSSLNIAAAATNEGDDEDDFDASTVEDDDEGVHDLGKRKEQGRCWPRESRHLRRRRRSGTKTRHRKIRPWEQALGNQTLTRRCATCCWPRESRHLRRRRRSGTKTRHRKSRPWEQALGIQTLTRRCATCCWHLRRRMHILTSIRSTLGECATSAACCHYQCHMNQPVQ